MTVTALALIKRSKIAGSMLGRWVRLGINKINPMASGYNLLTLKRLNSEAGGFNLMMDNKYRSTGHSTTNTISSGLPVRPSGPDFHPAGKQRQQQGESDNTKQVVSRDIGRIKVQCHGQCRHRFNPAG